MFENIIEQAAVLQLQNDILFHRLAPSMLFFGPAGSGKGSASLELARVLSCEENAAWKCGCASCEKHRYLQHTDLLMLGYRSFAAEIAACSGAFLRNPSAQSTKMLFYRSIRKLQARFSPVLLEDDPKLSKLSSVLQSLEENLNEFLAVNEKTTQAALEKLCGSLIKSSLSLIDEGIGSTIPIAHIRKASNWCRLAPNGKRKTLIIENADNMRDEARNSLLKLLEEPPAALNIILTSGRREAIMPTILSRLRPYRFLKRSAEGEKEIIRRVFQDTQEIKFENNNVSLISAYLDSFVQGSAEKMYPLAAFFVSSLARLVAAALKRQNSEIPPIIIAIGERYSPVAGDAGFERLVKPADIIKKLLEASGNFENDSFSRFLKICLDMICSVMREVNDPKSNVYNDIFRKNINETDTAVNILNINVTLALEALLYNLKKSMLETRGANA